MTGQPVVPGTKQQWFGPFLVPVTAPAEPVTEQAWLGNTRQRQAYLPNGHRLPTALHMAALRDIEEARREKIQAELDAAAAERTVHVCQEPELWLDAETHTTRALHEIQDGNINAGIACLQAALAFALNYRHSLTEETNR